MIAKDSRELRAYQSAFQLTLKVPEITRSFPKEERYRLTDPMRRWSRSVCLNIAESWRKRRYSDDEPTSQVDSARPQLTFNTLRFSPPSTLHPPLTPTPSELRTHETPPSAVE